MPCDRAFQSRVEDPLVDARGHRRAGVVVQRDVEALLAAAVRKGGAQGKGLKKDTKRSRKTETRERVGKETRNDTVDAQDVGDSVGLRRRARQSVISVRQLEAYDSEEEGEVGAHRGFVERLERERQIELVDDGEREV